MRSCAGYECAGDVMELLVGVQKAFFEICCFFMYLFIRFFIVSFVAFICWRCSFLLMLWLLNRKFIFNLARFFLLQELLKCANGN